MEASKTNKTIVPFCQLCTPQSLYMHIGLFLPPKEMHNKTPRHSPLLTPQPSASHVPCQWQQNITNTQTHHTNPACSCTPELLHTRQTLLSSNQVAVTHNMTSPCTSKMHYTPMQHYPRKSIVVSFPSRVPSQKHFCDFAITENGPYQKGHRSRSGRSGGRRTNIMYELWWVVQLLL